MYVNKFVTYQTLTIYTGSNKLDTANSILGVDANHDGVFEKEDRLLEYCRDNHITSLVLYDLRDVLGRGVMVWNENNHRLEDLEDHLCRFMQKARQQYCIVEIGAAGQKKGFYNRFANLYTTPTPIFPFSPAQRNSPYFTPLLALAADPSIVLGDDRLPLVEEIKFWLRAGQFGVNNCNERINLLHEEFEFWNSNDISVLPSYVEINSSCTNY